MKRATNHPGQRELFETPADAKSVGDCDPIEQLRARLRQRPPKPVVMPAGQDVPRLSAMARSEIYK